MKIEEKLHMCKLGSVHFCHRICHKNRKKMSKVSTPRSPIIGQCPLSWTTHISLGN